MELKDLMTLAALIVTTVNVMFSLRLSSLSSKSKVLVDVFTDFRGSKYNEIRALLRAASTKGAIDTEAAFEPYREYSQFLNHIGQLLHRGYVTTQELYEMAGFSIIDTWRLLSPYILAVRKQSNPPRYYQFHFEYLVANLLEYQKEGNETIESLMAESAKKIRQYSPH
ncbi:MAG: DUF4760 domain-containing protein [Janthinobacterium lividum]